MSSPLIYLDHAGTTVPSRELLNSVFNDLSDGFIGNPHSSSKTNRLVDSARAEVLNFFKTSSQYYSLIFTSGTTASIKMVGDMMPWSDNSHFVYPKNSHTSLMALRSFTPSVWCFPSEMFSSGINILSASSESESTPSTYSLIGSVAESNFSGEKSNLSESSVICKWLSQNGAARINELLGCKKVREGFETSDSNQSSNSKTCQGNSKWLWLLDAAKLVSTSPLDLSGGPSGQDPTPDFVTISFYKIFGYPTGLGALLVKNEVIPLLRKKFYGGGTVMASAADSMFTVPNNLFPLHGWTEDGTCHFQGILALKHGFAEIKSLGGMKCIQLHTHQLAYNLAANLTSLVHSSGQPLCQVLGKHNLNIPFEEKVKLQGPIVTFVLWWSDGSPIGSDYVGKLAEENNIILRTGCFCCIGGCQEALGLSEKDIRINLVLGRKCGLPDETCGSGTCDPDEFAQNSSYVLNGRHTGAVRASFGASSTAEDCQALVEFLKIHFLDRNDPYRVPGSGRTTALATPLYSLSEELSVSSSHSNEAKLVAIVIYPIKSCSGIRVKRWPLSPSGLFLDRHWAIVSCSSPHVTGSSKLKQTDECNDGCVKSAVFRVLSLRTCPRLALIRPDINLRDGLISLSGAGAETSVSASLDLVSPKHETALEVVACGHGASKTVTAYQVSQEVDEWLSEFLERPCKLVRLRSSSETEVSPQTFANSSVASSEAQLLVVSTEMFQMLQQFINKKMSVVSSTNTHRVGLDNFRPNLVISGVWSGVNNVSSPDAWKQIQFIPITESDVPVHIQNIQPCERCGVINVNPSTGQKESTDGGLLNQIAEMIVASESNSDTKFSPVEFGTLCGWAETTQELLNGFRPLWISEESRVITS